jgi:hypothetical protein
MSKKFLPYLTFLIAITTAGIAAYYSVSGLMKLFGNSLAIGMMAATLEAAKLMLSSILYRYWRAFSVLLKTYLTTAVGILAIITSIGIYGFMSTTYQKAQGKYQLGEKEVAYYESKISNCKDQVKNIQTSLSTLGASKNSVINTTTISYTDRRGFTNTRPNIKALKYLDTLQVRETSLYRESEKLQDSIQIFTSKINTLKTQSIVENELGGLYFIAARTGQPVDTVVNWLIIAFITVFDPLAIALMVGANVMLKDTGNGNLPQPKPEKVIEAEPVQEEPIIVEPEPVTETNPLPTDPYAEIRSNPNFSEWKKKQLINARMREERTTPEGKRYL